MKVINKSKIEIINRYISNLKELVISMPNNVGVGSPMQNLFNIYIMMNDYDIVKTCEYQCFSRKVKERFNTHVEKPAYKMSIVDAVLNFDNFEEKELEILKKNINKRMLNCIAHEDKKLSYLVFNSDEYKIAKLIRDKYDITFDVSEYSSISDIKEQFFNEYSDYADKDDKLRKTMINYFNKKISLPMYLKGDEFFIGIKLK